MAPQKPHFALTLVFLVATQSLPVFAYQVCNNSLEILDLAYAATWACAKNTLGNDIQCARSDGWTTLERGACVELSDQGGVGYVYPRGRNGGTYDGDADFCSSLDKFAYQGREGTGTAVDPVACVKAGGKIRRFVRMTTATLNLEGGFEEPKNTTLEICNRLPDAASETLGVAIARRIGEKFKTVGWYTLAPKKCEVINYGVHFETEDLYFFAENTSQTREWKGNDATLCIDRKGSFDLL